MFYISFALVIIIDIVMFVYFLYRKRKLGIRRTSSMFSLFMVMLLVNMAILLFPYFFEMHILDVQFMDDADVRNIHFPWFVTLPFLLIQIVQSTTMDASYDVILNVLFAKNYNQTFIYVYLYVSSLMSFLLPLSFILTVTSAFYGKVSYLWACLPFSRWKNIYVFNEVNDTVVSLISEIDASEKGPGARYIFCREKEDPAGKYEDELGILRVSYTRHGPYDVLRSLKAWHKNREIYYLFLSDTDDRNAEDLIELQQRLSLNKDHLIIDRKDEDGSTNKLVDQVFAVAIINNSELGSLLNFEEMHIRTRIYDRSMETAYDLFLKYPLFAAWDGKKQTPDEKIRIRVMVLGKGSEIDEVIRCAAWMGTVSRMSVSITYFGKDAEQLKKRFEVQYPGLMNEEQSGGMEKKIFFETRSFQDIDGSTFASFDYIIADYKNDEKNIRTGMQIRTMCRRQLLGTPDQDSKKPFIAIRITNSEKARNLRNIRIQGGKVNYDLYPFGTETQLFGKTNLLDNPVMKWMVMVQLSYSLKDTRKKSKSMEELLLASEQELYTDIYTYTNTQANAVYIFTRLFDSGAVEAVMKEENIIPDGRSICDLIREAFPEAFTLKQISETAGNDAARAEQLRRRIFEKYQEIVQDEDQLVRLSRAEHERWNVCMAAFGWISMPLSEMKQFMDLHGSAHKDMTTQRHPCITQWENLETVGRIKYTEADADHFIQNDKDMVRLLPWMLNYMYQDSSTRLAGFLGSLEKDCRI